MPFESGSFSFTVLELPQPLPEGLLELFADRAAGTVDSVTDELQLGWVSGRHLLENTISEETCFSGGAYMLTLRKAIRKIQPAYLNALCTREGLVWKRANGRDFVPGKVRREIKEEIMEKYLKNFIPSLAGIPMMLDPATGMLYVGAASNAQVEEFCAYFIETTRIDPVRFSPNSILNKMGKAITDLPSLELATGGFGEPVAGRDFLTWLWYFNETINRVEHPLFGAFAVALDGPLVFANDSDCNGAAETVVRNGENPLRSAEAKAALVVGKKLKKAKLSLVRDEQVWSCTFDADNFNFSSFKPPEGEKLGAEEALTERVYSTGIFKEGIDLLFRTYADAMLGSEREALIADMRKWAAERVGV